MPGPCKPRGANTLKRLAKGVTPRNGVCWPHMDDDDDTVSQQTVLFVPKERVKQHTRWSKKRAAARYAAERQEGDETCETAEACEQAVFEGPPAPNFEDEPDIFEHGADM